MKNYLYRNSQLFLFILFLFLFYLLVMDETEGLSSEPDRVREDSFFRTVHYRKSNSKIHRITLEKTT